MYRNKISLWLLNTQNKIFANRNAKLLEGQVIKFTDNLFSDDIFCIFCSSRVVLVNSTSGTKRSWGSSTVFWLSGIQKIHKNYYHFKLFLYLGHSLYHCKHSLFLSWINRAETLPSTILTPFASFKVSRNGLTYRRIYGQTHPLIKSLGERFKIPQSLIFTTGALISAFLMKACPTDWRTSSLRKNTPVTFKSIYGKWTLNRVAVNRRKIWHHIWCIVKCVSRINTSNVLKSNA